jgi:hypothetical protein
MASLEKTTKDSHVEVARACGSWLPSRSRDDKKWVLSRASRFELVNRRRRKRPLDDDIWRVLEEARAAMEDEGLRTGFCQREWDVLDRDLGILTG